MLRRLLTLLAICAGLVAVSEPARAAINTVETVRLAERSGAVCAPSSAVSGSLVSLSGDWPLQRTNICPKPTIVLVVPTVMLKVDRARE